MKKRTTIAAAAAAVTALAAGGAAIAGAAAGGGDDGAKETAITGTALKKASAAALDRVPGRVTQTEKGDEEGAYEVEVTKADGSQVDVELDAGFNVLSSKGDREAPSGGGR